VLTTVKPDRYSTNAEGVQLPAADLVLARYCKQIGNFRCANQAWLAMVLGQPNLLVTNAEISGEKEYFFAMGCIGETMVLNVKLICRLANGSTTLAFGAPSWMLRSSMKRSRCRLLLTWCAL